MALNGQYKFRLIAQRVRVLVETFSLHVANGSAHTLLLLVSSVYFHHPLLELLWSFSLFNHCNHEPVVYEDTDVFIEGLLRETHVEFLGAAHPVEVQQFLADDGITVKDFIELAKFEEKDLLVVSLLDVPVLLHARCEGQPLFLRDEKCSGIVVGVIGLSLFNVHDVIFFDELGSCVSDLLH